MNSLQFRVENEDGSNLFFDVIATYHDDDRNKDFIVYTDGTKDEDNKLKIYYSLYEEVDNNIKLIEINDIEDKKIGLQLIQELIKDIDN